MIRKNKIPRLFDKKTEKPAVLKVGEKIVSIQTSEMWRGLQIQFKGKVEINSLLPDDYIVESGVSKIIIAKHLLKLLNNFKKKSPRLYW